jgi:hypothetical protein
MSLERIIRIRDAVNGLCRAIDAGEVTPTEPEMLALALVVERDGGPLAHDLLCQLASRCRNGREVLDHMDRAPRTKKKHAKKAQD